MGQAPDAPAGSAPVVVGAGLAVHDGVFAWLPAVAALVGGRY